MTTTDGDRTGGGGGGATNSLLPELLFECTRGGRGRVFTVTILAGGIFILVPFSMGFEGITEGAPF